MKLAGILLALVTLPGWLGAQTPPPFSAAAARRGAQLYAASCATCHGPAARGTTRGPDLIRSTAVLADRLQQLHGADFRAVLARAPHAAATPLTAAQLDALSAFLSQQVTGTLRNHAFTQPSHMLAGDAAAGKAYFNGAGGCAHCHSPTGDLAGIARDRSPVALQQLWVFPNAARFGPNARPAATRVTVTPAAGAAVSGTLIHLDDFTVSLRDAAGQYQSFARGPQVKVNITDPYAAHFALLDRLTDADIHNLTAYLETLQ